MKGKSGSHRGSSLIENIESNNDATRTYSSNSLCLYSSHCVPALGSVSSLLLPGPLSPSEGGRCRDHPHRAAGPDTLAAGTSLESVGRRCCVLHCHLSCLQVACSFDEPQGGRAEGSCCSEDGINGGSAAHTFTFTFTVPGALLLDGI